MAVRKFWGCAAVGMALLGLCVGAWAQSEAPPPAEAPAAAPRTDGGSSLSAPLRTATGFRGAVVNLLIHESAIQAAKSGTAMGTIILLDYVGLLIASVVGVAVIIERAIRLRRSRLLDRRLAEAVPTHLAAGRTDQAVAAASASRTILGVVLAKELTEYQKGHVPIEEACEAAGNDAADLLGANMDILALVAKIAPLLGLLGTVLGMMFAFGQLDVGTKKETLAHAITVALDTTVRGLIIAIFCLGFERYFFRRSERAARDLESIFTRIVRAARRTASVQEA